MDLISREDALGEIKARFEDAREWYRTAKDEDIKARAEATIMSFTECSLMLKRLPSAEVGTQMSSADLISRQDAIDSIVAWTVEDRPDIVMPTDLVDRVNALPSADASLMQDRCKIDASSDLISRQDAIDALSRGSGCGNSCRRAIKALPSADRKGKWVPSHIPESTLCECDQCGFDCGAYSFSYCPNCGARMVSK